MAALVVSGCGGKSATETVTVPRVPARNELQAYALLHAAGLKVAIPSQRLFSLAIDSELYSRIETKPAAGAVVQRGSVVIISFRRVRCSASGACHGPTIGGLALSPPSSAKVPNFVGAPLSQVVRWASRHGLLWFADAAPPLPASDRPTLLDNYLVIRQSPAPGTVVRRPVRRPANAPRYVPFGTVRVRVALRRS